MRTSNFIFGLIAFLLAACATVSSDDKQQLSTTSWAADQTLVCEGLDPKENFPRSRISTRSITVVIVLNQDPALTQVAEFDKLSPICRPKETKFDYCKAKQDQESLDVTNVTDMISTTVQLNKRTGQLNYGIGGLDGAWNFQGICKAK